MLKNIWSRRVSTTPDTSAWGSETKSDSDREKRRTSTSSRQSGPSVMGILASKRLAKRLSKKAIVRREKEDKSTVIEPGVEREPTYRMEPMHKFSPCIVEQLIKKTLEERLQGFSYHKKFCANMTKVLSDEIKEKVKALHFDRYRIICLVCICERNDQNLVMSSRCTWDARLDTFATHTYKNPNIHCTVTVYGVHQE